MLLPKVRILMVQKIMMVVIFCQCLGQFSPRYLAYTRDYDDLLNILQHQPVLQCCFLLSTIPAAIVGKIFLEEYGAQGLPKKTPAKPKKPENASSDCSLISLERGLFKEKDLPGQSSFQVSALAAGKVYSGISLDEVTLCLSIAWKGKGFAILLLMLCILLPRGSLDENDSFIKMLAKVRGPMWKHHVGPFHLGENT